MVKVLNISLKLLHLSAMLSSKYMIQNVCIENETTLVIQLGDVFS